MGLKKNKKNVQVLILQVKQAIDFWLCRPTRLLYKVPCVPCANSLLFQPTSAVVLLKNDCTLNISQLSFNVRWFSSVFIVYKTRSIGEKFCWIIPVKTRKVSFFYRVEIKVYNLTMVQLIGTEYNIFGQNYIVDLHFKIWLPNEEG